MSSTTDLRTLAATVMRDAGTDLAAVFGQLAEDCGFARANETPVHGVDDSQALVGVLAGVSGFRHDISEQLVGEDRPALRIDVTSTLPHGGELSTPAVTYTRLRDERIVEYRICQTAAVRLRGRPMATWGDRASACNAAPADREDESVGAVIAQSSGHTRLERWEPRNERHGTTHVLGQ
jgi:SnoaL-like domain